MKPPKHTPAGRVWLISLCAMAVFALGAAGSAPARTLLFVPSTGFPYDLAAEGGGTHFESVGGVSFSLPKVHTLVRFLNATLFNLNLLYLGVTIAGIPCSNTSISEEVLLDLLGHLGLADPGGVPAVLLLVPSGFEFNCSGASVKIRGSLIGEIAKPAILTFNQTELLLRFEQSKGIQKFTTFLLANTLLINQFEEINANGFFEQYGQAWEVTPKATSFGSFEIRDE